MSERRLRSALTELPLPEETEARERTWRVVSAAYAQSQRLPDRRRLRLRPVLVLALAAALAAAVLSAPGQAVLDSVRKAIGISHAQPALFSLPARGNLVATSATGGAWVVRADGSKRHLGSYREASWSPFGHYLVAGRADELAALTLKGGLRWTLSRPSVRFPRWGGSLTDTRIAYLSGSRLRVVAGDGTGDRAIAGVPAAAEVAPAWRPGRGFVLAYADTHGRVNAYGTASGSFRFRTAPGPMPSKLEWSSDGRLLLVLSPRRLRVYDAAGRLLARDNASAESRDADATFLPGSHTIALVKVTRSDSEVSLLGSGRILFRTSGQLAQVVPSPDGRWLLLSWPAADQWIFVRISGGRRIAADSNIAAQLGGFPTIGGWCCLNSR